MRPFSVSFHVLVKKILNLFKPKTIVMLSLIDKKSFSFDWQIYHNPRAKVIISI